MHKLNFALLCQFKRIFATGVNTSEYIRVGGYDIGEDSQGYIVKAPMFAEHWIRVRHDEKRIILASVKVRREYQGRGIFSEFLRAIETFAKNAGYVVEVESIFNDHLYDHLKRRGYTDIAGASRSVEKV